MNMLTVRFCGTGVDQPKLVYTDDNDDEQIDFNVAYIPRIAKTHNSY